MLKILVFVGGGLADSLISYGLFKNSPKNEKVSPKRKAFTLAEILIVLIIIGVIAVLTLPSLLTKYDKMQTEVKVKEFYSTINNAFRLSAIDNGNPEEWVQKDKNYTQAESEEWLKKYLFPYMKYERYEKPSNSTALRIYLLKGGVMTFGIDGNGGDIFYYTDVEKSKKFPQNKHRYLFSFQFNKKPHDTSTTINSTNFVEPYTFQWNGTIEHLKGGHDRSCYVGCVKCNWCAKLLEVNSWHITDDYPW